MANDQDLQEHAYARLGLGERIPDSPHAVSVCLPRWQDVVGYEEKKPEVMARLQGGYPRFVINARVREVALRLGGGRPCLPFPSERAARSCVEFILKEGAGPAEMLQDGSMWAVATGEKGAASLKAFWQHAGLIVSSRRAEAWLDGRSDDPDASQLRSALRRRLAGFYDCGEEDVFLAPTGMAAQLAALGAALARRPGRPTVQLGFPYVDSFKLQQKLGFGTTLLHDLESIPAELRRLLARDTLAACFCEIPGNPLLGSPDLSLISPMLRGRGVPLIVDDAVATPFNVDLSARADLVVASLTKFILGSGDAMGGAVVANPHSPYHAELKAALAGRHEELLWGEDAAVLETQAAGFPERMKRHNANALFIAGKLRVHPAVERVWYPKWECAEAYEALRRPAGGWGGLVAFLTRDPERTAPAVFDRLELAKGPSFGTVWSLACPFTLLAHYGELDWAEACGVPRHLIRLSVGLEEPAELWRRIESALAMP